MNPKDKIGRTKAPLRLIPPPSLIVLAKALECGALKYTPYNWREQPVNATVYIEAAMRHLLSALDGEDLDPESGQHHVGHAMACCAIYLDAWLLDNLNDDRPIPGCFAEMSRETVSS